MAYMTYAANSTSPMSIEQWLPLDRTEAKTTPKYSLARIRKLNKIAEQKWQM